MNNLFILRGVPGCGKSTLANVLTNNETTGIICEADRYFIGTDEVYRFDLGKIGQAHQWCRERCESAMSAGASTVVVSNTNTTPKEFADYEKMADIHGYRVTHIVVENRHHSVNAHGVPEETLMRMELMLRANLVLR